MNKQKILNQLYYGFGPAAYGSIDRLYSQAHKAYPQITRSDVQAYLESQVGYQRTKQKQHDVIPKYQSKRFHQPSGTGEIGADVMYLDKFPGPYKYALVVTGLLTKVIIIKFMKSLTSKTAKEAFRRAIDDYPFDVKQVHTDAGWIFFS